MKYALSGDVAADLLAPWARPTRALVYVDQALDLMPLGLTPAPPDAATLELVVPDDPYVLRDARLLTSDLVIAYLNGEDCGDLLDRYEPHPDGAIDPALGFVRPDREAYAEFARRLAQ